MRLMLALVVVGALAIGGVTPSAVYAGEGEDEGAPVIENTSVQTGEDGDGEDDTVNVQLVVFGIVGGFVFLLLPLGYLLRRRLGLTAYTPPAADAHH
jgi:hypothetical protein